MRNKKLGVGIIGFGVSGRYFHAPFIHCRLELELKAVVLTRKEEIQALYPYVQVLSDPDQLFENREIDLVIVATPNTSHFELGKKALEHGKHVIIEKPFAPTSGEARELTSIAKINNLVLSVYHNRRWDGDFLTVRKIIEGGILGSITEFESHFDRYRPVSDPQRWRNIDQPGSGLLFDLGSHLIDQAVCLFGKPYAIWADIRIVEEASLVDDCFEVRLQYDGLDVTLKASNFVSEPGPRFVLKGARGSFIKSGLDPQEKMLRDGIMPDTANWGKDDACMYGILNAEINGYHSMGAVETLAGNYAGYFTNVYGTIANNEALAVRPEEASLVIEIIEKAFESSKQRHSLEL